MSEHLVVMDDDYAKLSLLVGMFAFTADRFLGRLHFIPITSQQPWTYTWEKLAAWKAEAIQMGVPAKALELDRKMKKALPRLIEEGKRRQAKADRRNPSGIVH